MNAVGMDTVAKLVRHLVCLGMVLACAQRLPAQTQPIQYYYDDVGRLVTMVDQSGNVVTYTYDAVGNILAIDRSTVTQGQLAIFDFNPETGPASTVVTIRGQGFSATASSDAVKFNGTVATVTSATTTSLVTTVPAGATTGPISVTVNGNTATSSNNFVVSQIPVIQSTLPKAALFGAVITPFQVIGANLLGATFSFSPPGPTISTVVINSTGTSATMTVSVGVLEGTFAMVATTSAGNSGIGTTQANWFTVVSPASTDDSDGDGFPDVEEAAYGTDPLNVDSYPTGSSVPLSGEVDGVLFSVLDTSEGTQPIQYEADGVLFSVLDTSQGTQPVQGESDGILCSVLDTSEGSQPVQDESDGILFSVQNNAGTAKVTKKTTRPARPVGRGRQVPAPTRQEGTAGASTKPEATVQQGQPKNQK
jgi:YD repeat-containing protein